MPQPPAAPIFIGGTGRSGTTALARLLGHHPDVMAIRWESQFIVSPGGLIDLLRRDYEKQALTDFLGNLRGRWYRRVLREGQPNEYEAGLCADITHDHLEASIEAFLEHLGHATLPDERYLVARTLVDRLFEEPIRLAKASRWVEKTPRNVLYAEHLWQMFPEMKLINMLRDGRDVASSMVARGFWPIGADPDFPSLSPYRGEPTVAKALGYWVEVLKQSRIRASRIPADRYLEIRLEDLVEHTGLVLGRLCRFLGLPVVPELFEYNLDRPHTGRWRESFTDEQVRMTEERFGYFLALEGYR